MDKTWKPQLRSAISNKVRELRKKRGLSQTALAQRLGLSQARLSIIEKGDGSFSAEQFLEILRIFNVSPQAFWTGKKDVQGDLQNALARHGALHLVEDSELLPSDQLEEVEGTVREVLLAGDDPRQVAALAPVLAWNVANLNLNRLWARFVEYGLENRLGWALENAAEAIHSVVPSLAGKEQNNLRKAEGALRNFLARKHPPQVPENSITVELDVLDGIGLSNKTTSNLWANASPVSHRWLVVTALQVEDFINALLSSFVVGRSSGTLSIGGSATGTVGRPKKDGDDAH